MSDRSPIRSDEMVRALSAAAAAVRLYPPTSDIPAQAVAHAVEVCATVTASSGPARFTVEPKSFKLGDQVIGEHTAHVAALAEALYAHQVGNLIVAPGLTESEVNVFLRCASAEPAAVREEGGLRSVLVTAGVTHLAVIELTMRASTEEGLAGIDLTSAPLDVIGPAVVRATADWARSASGGEGVDALAAAIGSLESAARDLASERIAQAMARLDEQTRIAVLAAALRTDSAGRDMDGMLSVIAGMKPATLARLLKLAASRTGTDASTILGRLDLTPDAARAIALLLRPAGAAGVDTGVPARVDAAAIAEDAMEEDALDDARIRAAVEGASPALAAGRALATAISLAGERPGPDALDAVGAAIGPALAGGAFEQVVAAAAMLDAAARDATLEPTVRRARAALVDLASLARACERVHDDATAQAAAPVFALAGATGAEALLSAWAGAEPARRRTLEAVVRADADQVLTVAGRRVRAGDPGEAIAVIGLLGRLGDRRAAPVLAQALDNRNAEVRAAAVESLAQLDTPEAWRVVAGALHHRDEQTASRALYEIRMARARGAVQDLIATLSSPRSARSWGFKREVVDCLKDLRAVEAVPALKREAGHIFAFTTKRRMLRQAARDALEAIKAGPERG